MPIDIQCNECKKRFRVPDKFAERRIKCPNCEKPIAVPAADSAEADSAEADSAEADSAKAAPSDASAGGSGGGGASAVGQLPTAAPQEAARPEPSALPKTEAASEEDRQTSDEEGQWYLQTDDGEQYGPVDREELDAWLAEGRIDGTCQLLCDGWDQWQWADKVFPQLAEGAATEDILAKAGDDSRKLTVQNVSTRSDPKLKPHAAPRADLAGGIDQMLDETRPWVLLLAIVGFVGAGLGGAASLVMLVLSAVTLAIPGILIALVGLATYGLAGWAAFHLFVYAQRIRVYVASSGTADLEQVLEAQRSFWRLAGIVVLVTLGIWLLAALLLLILLLAGVAWAAAG